MTSGPKIPYPPVTLPELIGAQARSRPSAPAVRQWQDRLSYGELWSMATDLAQTLRAAGCGPETRVCVCAHRRPPAVAALIGIQLSGAAYVPLDPADPPARQAIVAADAGAPLVVADDETASGLAALGLPVIRMPAKPTQPAQFAQPAQPAPPSGADCPARPENAAYVLYTSGSTGTPKGVVVTHENLTSYVTAFGAFTGAGPSTRSFAFASFGFDVSVIDLFVPLAAGGEVELLGAADRSDPDRLQRFCEEHAITWGCVPVAVLPMLDPGRLPAWRTLITGAEAPGPEQVARWTGPDGRSHRRFLNCYGPTEATVCVTAFQAGGTWERPLPIGLPLPNHRVHVVDEQFREVPAGTPGELVIGGAGLARGYLGRPALTARQFVPDPFGADPGARLYRTGDIAAWRDGALEFLGRADGQVKIRGRRVEIGEVETVLRGLPQVRHAVVDVVADGDSRRLVAFCALVAGADEAAVGAACARALPPALVPSAVIAVPDLPLNAAGKVDLAALRSALPGGERRPGRAPAGPVQTAVAASWRKVLGRAEVTADDDFFASGGHSIAAMRLVADLRTGLRRAVSMEDVFGGRTLAEIAERAAAAPALDDIDLVTGNPAALSPAQRRLWFLDKLAPGSAAYNIALAERVAGPLDIAALEAALAAVIARHEVLRWRIGDDPAGRPVVSVRPPGPIALPIEDAAEEALAGLLEAEARSPFDLAADPLWRARLIRLAPDEHVLALTFHHAVFDGWSQRPFYEDLGRAYRAAVSGGDPTLASPPAGFSDYVAWRAERDRQRGDADLKWWGEHLAGAPPAVDLPRDAARPRVQTYRGEMVSGGVGGAVFAAIGELSQTLGATGPAVLLAGFSAFVHRLTGQRDLVIGTPTADRRHLAFGDLVGFFIEVMPLRVRVDPAASFADLARSCSDELIAALAHPAAPLERIVDVLGLPRDPGRPPLVQVLFNVYNYPEPGLRLDGATSRRLAPGLGGSPFDLTVYIAPMQGRPVVDVVYNPDLFGRPRVQAFVDCYLGLLEALMADPAATVGAVPLPAGWAAAADAPVVDAPVADGPVVDGPVTEQPQPVPAAGRFQPPVAGAAPPSQAEQTVAAIWRDVLGLTEVGLTVNFFDAGGTSLALVAVRTRVAERFGRELSIAELFQYPTVRALARHLQGGSGSPELARAAARGAARRQRAGLSRREHSRPEQGG